MVKRNFYFDHNTCGRDRARLASLPAISTLRKGIFYKRGLLFKQHFYLTIALRIIEKVLSIMTTVVDERNEPLYDIL